MRRLYDDSVAQQGFLMNLTRLWAHQPALHRGLFELVGQAARAGELTFRQRAILVVAAASAFGDGYCSLAWGSKLSGVAGDHVAGQVLRGDDDWLDPTERALAGWARRVARDPNATEARDLQPLRDAGYDDAQIFAITVFRRPPPGLRHRERRARRTAGRRAAGDRSGRRPSGRHVRKAGRRC